MRERKRKRERKKNKERTRERERESDPHRSFYRVGLSDLRQRTTISVAHLRERGAFACCRMPRYGRTTSRIDRIFDTRRSTLAIRRFGRRQTENTRRSIMGCGSAWLRAAFPFVPADIAICPRGRTLPSPFPPPYPRSISLIPFIELPCPIREWHTTTTPDKLIPINYVVNSSTLSVFFLEIHVSLLLLLRFSTSTTIIINIIICIIAIIIVIIIIIITVNPPIASLSCYYQPPIYGLFVFVHEFESHRDLATSTEV